MSTQPAPGRDIRRFGHCLVPIILLAFCCTTAALGQTRPGFRTLDCVVDRKILSDLADLLQLDHDQLVVAESLWLDYYDEVSKLEEQTSRLVDQISRQYNPADGSEPSEEARTERAVEWHNAVAAARREADALLATWLESLQSTLTDEQIAVFPKVLPLVHRRNFHFTSETLHWADYGFPVDVLQLAAHASLETDALLPLDFLRGVSDEPAPLLEDPSELVQQYKMLADQYESEVDAAVMKIMVETRKHIMHTLPVLSQHDPEELRELRKRGRSRAARIEIMRRMIRSVGSLLELGWGETTRLTWTEYCHRKIAPVELGYYWIDEVIADLPEDLNLTEAQQAALSALYTDYRRERSQLQDRAFTGAIGAIRRTNYRFGNPEDPDAKRHARAVLGLEDLHERTLDACRGLLDDVQRAAFDRSIETARTERVLLFKRHVPSWLY